MINTCIFDLDGVIVDTAKFHFIAWQELAQKLGFNFSKKDNEQLKGVSRMRSLDILLKIGNLSFNENKKIELATEKNNRYVQLISSLTKKDILPGVFEFMQDIKSKNIKLVLGSASKNAKTILKSIQLYDFFDAIIDGTNVSKAKPNPEVFLIGAKAVNSLPQNCIVFEDAYAGIEAAKLANMLAIGIGNRESLPNADFVIENFRNIKLNNILEKAIKL